MKPKLTFHKAVDAERDEDRENPFFSFTGPDGLVHNIITPDGKGKRWWCQLDGREDCEHAQAAAEQAKK